MASWASLFAGYPKPKRGHMVTVTCESAKCAFRNHLARRITEPTEVRIVCHGCEHPLRAFVTQDDIDEIVSRKQRAAIR